MQADSDVETSRRWRHQSWCTFCWRPSSSDWSTKQCWKFYTSGKGIQLLSYLKCFDTSKQRSCCSGCWSDEIMCAVRVPVINIDLGWPRMVRRMRKQWRLRVSPWWVDRSLHCKSQSTMPCLGPMSDWDLTWWPVHQHKKAISSLMSVIDKLFK